MQYIMVVKHTTTHTAAYTMYHFTDVFFVLLQAHFYKHDVHPMNYRLVRDPRANYKQSMSVLEQAKKSVPKMVTKSSIMLGCGETDQQVLQALKGEQQPNTW